MRAIFPGMDNVYIFIVDLICGLGDACLLLRLYYRVYGKARFSMPRMSLLMAGLFLLSALGWRLYTPYFRPTALPPLTVLVSLFLLPCFSYSRYQKKVLFSLILLATASFLLTISDMVMTPLDIKLYLLAYIVPHVLFWLALEIIGYIGRKKRISIPPGMYLILGVIAFISILIFCATLYYFRTAYERIDMRLLLLIQLALLFINIALFVVYDRFGAYTGMQREKAVLEEQLRLQKRHYQELEAMQQQISRLHHDMKNHLRTAAALYKEKKGDTLKRYLLDAEEQMFIYETIVQSGNEALDTILSLKIGELTADGVRVSRWIKIPPQLRLSFHQVTTIWGNLLDNAKEACAKLAKEERSVEISIVYMNRSVVSVIKNPYAGTVNFLPDGLPASTKGADTPHGIGLANVRQAVEDMGSMEVSTDDHIFTVTLVLYER